MFCLFLVTEWLQLLQTLSLHNTTSKARRGNWLLWHVSMCLLWHCIFPRCIQPTSPKPITSKWKYPDKLSSIIDHPLGLGEDVLAAGDRASFDLWFKAHAIFSSTGPHPKRASSTSWLLSWAFKRPLRVLSGRMYMVISMDPIVTCPLLLLCRKMSFLVADQC